MAIMVHYTDDSYGYVKNNDLERLIDDGGIVAFRRSSGWAEIGKDPLRQMGKDSGYNGSERRVDAASRSCLVCGDFVDSICRTNSCSTRKSLQGKSYQHS